MGEALWVFRALWVAAVTEGLVLDSVEKTALARSRLAQQDHADVVGALRLVAGWMLS